jgi:hypothetical protein
MKPDDLPRFLRELAELRLLPPGERAAPLLALFERSDFAPKSLELRAKKRRCRVPAITLAKLTTHHRDILADGYARRAYVPETTLQEIVWCPHLNTVLLYVSSYTGEDTYNRIPSRRITSYSLLDHVEAAARIAAAI